MQETIAPPTEITESKEKGSNIFVDLLETVVISLAICMVIYLTLATPNQVEGQSMEPNFHDQELLFTNKVIQWLGETAFGKNLNYNYERGDVVIFHHNKADLIKRIIAREGDTIRFSNNEVYVNGKQLDELYIQITTRTTLPPVAEALVQEDQTIRVPEGYFFVMGDNRENSRDSRFKDVGFISRNDVKGRVFFRYWPLDKFGIIRRGEYQEKSVDST